MCTFWTAVITATDLKEIMTSTCVKQSIVNRTLTTFKLEGEVTSLSGSSQGEVEDNREKWGDLWEKLIVINRNIVLRPL